MDMEEEMDTSGNHRISAITTETSTSNRITKFEKLITENLPERKCEDHMLENLVSLIKAEVETLAQLGKKCMGDSSNLNRPDNLNVLQIITKLCNSGNYETLLDSGLIKVCLYAIRTALIPSDFVKHCIGIVDAVCAFDVATCEYISGVTKQSQDLFENFGVTEESPDLFQNLCRLFEIFSMDGKTKILHLFDTIVKQALELDDYVFDAILFKTCSVVHSADTDLLCQCVVGIDNLIETYQEWEVIAKLLQMSMVPSLVALLIHPKEEIVLKTLRSLGNLLSAENQTINQCVISGGLLNHIMMLLIHQSPSDDIVRNTLLVLSNVAVGPKGSIKYFFDLDLFATILSYLKCNHGDVAKCNHGDVALEALWVSAILFDIASSDQRKLVLKNREIMAFFVCCLTKEKSEMQRSTTEGIVYLELLSDTFKTVMKCLKKPKGNRNSNKKGEDGSADNSDSEEADDSDYEEADNSDSEDDVEGPFDILSLDEIKTLSKYLGSQDFHTKLDNLNSTYKDEPIRESFKEIFDDFISLMKDHLDIELNLDYMG